YTATITDANGCSDTATFTITQPAAMQASISNWTNVSCHGGSDGSAKVSVSGGVQPYSYTWTPGGSTQTSTYTTSTSNGISDKQTATGLPAGSYTVTVTDDYGCTKTANVTIT